MTDLDIWIRRGCATVVAAVAAYASYEHQREFALQGGADQTGSSLWPLSVDGLLVLATVGLLKHNRQDNLRARYAVRLAFFLGIAVSLAANVAAAPMVAWQPVLVAGWPPVALLLAVELLAHSPRDREQTEIDRTAKPEAVQDTEAEREPDPVVTLAVDKAGSRPPNKPTAEQIMWAHYQREQASGRTPTGAELDRVAGTNNYGRSVLARWRRIGRISPAYDRSIGQAG
ncbi:DUF2637 domain-containing protein [Streptomyces malaysiensis]|uniref:DUF2637 domain-containing protein n=1 Tax=Streptomyces malaysiensis TaxID=92644 RepID=UPI000C9B27EC|nr:DUF2637 domain-containing protein [Streptomyces malaysiensis]